MLPLVLDVSRLKLALIGNGRTAERRLALLDEAGARDVGVYATAPSAALARRAGERLIHRLPRCEELAPLNLNASASHCGRPLARAMPSILRLN